MRIAVVSPELPAPAWSEPALLVDRLAGALACSAEVDLLVAGGRPGAQQHGAVRIVRFAVEDVSSRRRSALLRAAFGVDDFQRPDICSCCAPLAAVVARSLPIALQEHVRDLLSPPSADLRRHLETGRYDVVVAAGYVTAAQIAHTAGRRVLVPLARDEPWLHLPIFDATFAAADAIVVFSDVEKRLVEQRVEDRDGTRIANVGFVVRPDAVGVPRDRRRRRFVVARDWNDGFAFDWLRSLARGIARRFSDVELCLVGPGAPRVPPIAGSVVETVRSRRDVAAWTELATAVIDLEPRRLIGREVLEAMMLGTPVIVPACGGAAREHAEGSDGGLWFRSAAEIERAIELLHDEELHAALAARGREYAERRYGDPDRFIREVTREVTREVVREVAAAVVD